MRHHFPSAVPIVTLAQRLVLVGCAVVASACVDVLGTSRLVRFVQVDGREYGNCALSAAGQVYCWGHANSSSEGDPSFTMPVGRVASMVPGTRRFRAMAVGHHWVCALTEKGAAFCAGMGPNGELGTGASASSRAFLPVAGGHRWRSLAAGYFHTCGIRVQGDVYCWGVQSFGGLGNGESTGVSLAPVPIESDERFIAIAAGGAFTCALDTDGRIWCWGKNHSGELATVEGGGPAQPIPVRSDITERFVEIAAGGDQACARTASGVVWCWGYNAVGRLGRGSAEQTGTPAPVAGNRRHISLSHGDSGFCAMGTDGVPDCWGIWDYGITAPGNPRTIQFHNVPTAQRFSHIQFRDARAVGLNRCGLAVDGLLYCWGDGYHGGLGDGTTPAFRHAPSAPVISH